ncbi:VRR-NUC domain-containing protein [Spirosoma oryzicola]|uniref:VRR-NUC domain-containing protein n=1 Tax=Spirosoma oryzicola TaxID=2898794 RepID=UPI001E48F4D1|nr:VRR-NUC domain-containing protein [Spirosoma oryzicola]UHG91784.1 VRR-NUC domain-containing protein [Spirosoma oryzicola]
MPSDLITADQFQSLLKKHRPKATPEHDLQCEVVFDFDKDYPTYEGLLFAIPNGAKLPYKTVKGKRVCPEAIKLKKEGMRPGVPDLCLPVPKGRYHGLFVEMKYGDNKPSTEQVFWMQRLTKLGYCCKVCYTRQEARHIFKTYLSLE